MGVNITRAVGQLRRVEPTEDAVICMVMSGVATMGISLGEPKQIFGSDALTTLAIEVVNNPVAYRDISDFYAKAGEGAELNIMLVSDATTLEDICDNQNDIAKRLVDFTEGRAVILVVNKKLPVGYSQTIADGYDADVWAAVSSLQDLCSAYDNKNIPIIGILPGIGFDKDNISDIPARSTLTNDYVSLNNYCQNSDGHIGMGIIAGWLAKHQVHENIGRVASGKVTDTAFFPDGTPAKDLANAVTALDAKGIIFPIKVGSKAGYFFNDDHCLTAISSDYSSISWNRVINKAKRIAYTVLVEKLKDDVEIDPATGKIEGTVASDWESDVENAIRNQMMRESANKKKEISGIKVTVDPNSDILNSEVDVAINIVRKGQAKTINVTIGYVASV